jgi:hypothetical protein
MTPRNPLMAAVLAAALGLNSPGLSYAGETPQQPPRPAQPACPPSATETNSLNVLAAILHCEPADGPAKRDIGNRLIAFVLSTDAQGPLFVSRALLDSIPAEKRTPEGIAATLTGDAPAPYYAAIREWTKRATASEVAELYIVMGDANPPAWVTSNARLRGSIRALTGPDDRRAGLVPGLVRRWRNGNQGRIPFQADQLEQTSLFLFAAAADARGILSDPRTRAELRLSIETNERVPVVTAGPRPTVPGPVPQSGWDNAAYFQNGGVGGTLTGTGTRPDGSRGPIHAEYYIKIETQRDAASGALTNYIAVYDNSGNPPHIRRVPITARGEQPVRHIFPGADPNTPDGTWPLTLDIQPGDGGDLRVSLRRAGARQPGNEIVTSVSDLARNRYEQAASMARMEDGSLRVVNIGGQDYITGRQLNGTAETVLFYPANADPANWRGLGATAAANVRVAQGTVGPPNPDIGVVNGSPFHLELENGAWVVKPGRGTLPPPPAAATPAGATTGDPNTPGGVADRRVQADAATSNFTEDAQATAGLDQATRDRGYRIMSQPDPRNPQLKEYKIITPAGFLPHADERRRDNRTYGGIRPTLTGLGHYVVWQTLDGAVAYQDLLIRATQTTAPTAENPQGTTMEDFATVVQYDPQNRRIASVAAQQGQELRWLSDDIVIEHALRTHLGYVPGDANTVPAAGAPGNLTRALAKITEYRGGARYVIQGANASSIVLAKHPNALATSAVYPNIVATASTDNPATPAGQTGTVLDQAQALTSGDGAEPFVSEIGLSATATRAALRKLGPSGDIGSAEARASATAALYQRTSPPSSASEAEWYIMIKFRETRPSGNTVAKTSAMGIFVGHPAPAVSAVNVEGNTQYPTTGITVSSGARILPVQGTSQAKGAWILVPSAGTPSPTNCVSPVIWWGVTKQQAYDAGCNNRALP